MALVDPNIAMSYRGIELPNQLAQYGQIAQIQNAQNQNRMANLQAQEYERARGEEEGLRNYLTKANLAKPEERTGLFQFGKTGRDYLKTLAEQDTAAATLADTKSRTTERDFKLSQEKLKHGWDSLGSAGTPQEAVEKILDGVKKGYFDQATAEAEIGKIPQDPSQYKQYRIQKIMGLLDAKDKLAAVLPKNVRQEAGGKIVTIQDNPMLPGYSLPIAGMDITKTKTFGDITAEGQLGVARQQLGVAQGNAATSAGQLAVAQQRLALDQEKGTPLTESQGNATAFGMRMLDSDKLLNELEKGGTTSGGRFKGAVEGTLTAMVPYQGERLATGLGSTINALPGFLGGPSEKQQSYEQAKQNFITAVLRKESGASISPDEFAREEKKYFPQAGESDTVLAQKQRARKLAIDAMKIQAGPGAKNIGGAGGGAGGGGGGTPSASDPLGLGFGGR